MNTSDVAALAVIAIAPLALVLIFALLRGYTITVHLTRQGRRRDEDRDRD